MKEEYYSCSKCANINCKWRETFMFCRTLICRQFEPKEK